MSKTEQGKNEETNFNTILAELLRRDFLLGWEVKPQMTKQIKDSGRIPDIMMLPPSGDMAIVIECKYDTSVNRREVEDQSESHVGEQTIKGQSIYASVSLLYPRVLESVKVVNEEALLKRLLCFKVFINQTDEDGRFLRFPPEGWQEGDVKEFADFLKSLSDDVGLDREKADKFIEGVSEAAEILNCNFPQVAEAVMQENCKQTDQMVAALMLNALVFHRIVAAHHSDQIDSPSQMKTDGDITQIKVDAMWQKILDINYYPIFGVAKKCLREISDAAIARKFLEVLAETADDIASEDPYAAQTLAGEAFGALIADRKLLASYYTLPTSASLLAELAVDRLETDWGKPSEITSLKIADFACGTGALLTAVYKSISSRASNKGLDTSDIHRQMVEDVFIGADIMPAAVHITAASLSAQHPEIEYTKTQTHVMPFGAIDAQFFAPKKEKPPYVRLGSLEVVNQDTVLSLFGDGTSAVTAKGETTRSEMQVPYGECDIVIMNPPYIRATNHAIEERQKNPRPDFAALGVDENVQRLMGKREDELFKTLDNFVTDGRAGMGSNFFDVAHAKLRGGGWPPSFYRPRCLQGLDGQNYEIC